MLRYILFYCVFNTLQVLFEVTAFIHEKHIWLTLIFLIVYILAVWKDALCFKMSKLSLVCKIKTNILSEV